MEYSVSAYSHGRAYGSDDRSSSTSTPSVNNNHHCHCLGGVEEIESYCLDTNLESAEVQLKKKCRSEEKKRKKKKRMAINNTKEKEKRRKALDWVEGFDNALSLLSSSSQRKPETTTTKKKNKAAVSRALARARGADLKRAYDNYVEKEGRYQELSHGLTYKMRWTKPEQVEAVFRELADANAAASNARQFYRAVQHFSTGNNFIATGNLSRINLYNADDCTAYLYPPSPCCSSQSSCSGS